MPTTTTWGLPYPSNSDNVDIPGDMQALAEAVDTDLSTLNSSLASKLDTTVTTKGDLITRSSSAVSRLGVGANGHVLTADSAATLGIKWAAPAGGGKILQVVRATDATSRTTTSTSFVDASISVTITPTASNSAVLLIWATNAAHGGSSDFTYLTITDSSNNSISGANGVYIGSNTTNAFYTFVTVFAYATPATTSAVTYKGRFRVNASGTAELFNAGNLAQLYAIEVGA